jgi:hypothetical protein
METKKIDSQSTAGWNYRAKQHDPEREREYRTDSNARSRPGHEILKRGGSSTRRATEAAVRT